MSKESKARNLPAMSAYVKEDATRFSGEPPGDVDKLTAMPQSATGLPMAPNANVTALAEHLPPSVAKKRRKAARPIIPRRKKPKDMPKRPLSAYNLFFRSEREKILAKYRNGEEQEDFHVGAMEVTTQKESKEFNSKLFQEVARTIASRWKNMTGNDKKVFEDLASAEMDKYRQAVEDYEKKMVESSVIAKRRKIESPEAANTESSNDPVIKTSKTESPRSNGSNTGAPAGAQSSIDRPIAMLQSPSADSLMLSSLPRRDFWGQNSYLNTNPALGRPMTAQSSINRPIPCLQSPAGDSMIPLSFPRQDFRGQNTYPITNPVLGQSLTIAGLGGGVLGNLGQRDISLALPMHPGRSALLNLRQVEEQQRRQDAALMQAIAVEQQQQQFIGQPYLPVEQQYLRALLGQPTDAVPPPFSQQTLLEQVLTEQGQAHEAISLPNTMGTVSAPWDQYPQHIQLPSHTADSARALFGRNSIGRPATAGRAATTNPGGTGTNTSSSIQDMSAEGFASLVRAIEEEKRRRQT